LKTLAAKGQLDKELPFDSPIVRLHAASSYSLQKSRQFSLGSMAEDLAHIWPVLRAAN